MAIYLVMRVMVLSKYSVKDLSMHVTDIARNSVEAAASQVIVSFGLNKKEGVLEVMFEDNGRGMNAEMVKRVTDPFTTTRITRKVGLGLPLFKMSATQTGGSLQVESEPGKGTVVTAVFDVKHIDCVPLGDLAGAATLLITGNPGVMFQFNFNANGHSYSVSTTDIQDALGEKEISQPKVVRFIKEMIQENIKDIDFDY